jgi:hypothetical protein
MREKLRRKIKAGQPVSSSAPLHDWSGSAHELLWNFLPANQQRLRFRIALNSLRSSIDVREYEVKKKNFFAARCCETVSGVLRTRLHRAGVIAFARANVEENKEPIYLYYTPLYIRVKVL